MVKTHINNFFQIANHVVFSSFSKVENVIFFFKAQLILRIFKFYLFLTSTFSCQRILLAGRVSSQGLLSLFFSINLDISAPVSSIVGLTTTINFIILRDCKRNFNRLSIPRVACPIENGCPLNLYLIKDDGEFLYSCLAGFQVKMVKSRFSNVIWP